MKQKIIVVTGCSKKTGVGYQLAHELLQRGHRVIATVRNLAMSELQSNAHQQLSVKVLDLCNSHSIQKFIKDVLDEYKFIDVLVNNAAEVVVGAVETASEEDLKTTFQTKVFGPVSLIQGFLPSMRERRSGLIIATSSMFCAAPFVYTGIPIYLAALQAFERIQESLAVELAPWNIHVVNFQPGPIQTNLSRHDGSKTEITALHYPHYLSDAYEYFSQFQWQDPAEVAKVYADIIEAERPDFAYQSSTQTREFVKQYRADATSNAELKKLKEHFIRCAKKRIESK